MTRGVYVCEVFDSCNCYWPTEGLGSGQGIENTPSHDLTPEVG